MRRLRGPCNGRAGAACSRAASALRKHDGENALWDHCCPGRRGCTAVTRADATHRRHHGLRQLPPPLDRRPRRLLGRAGRADRLAHARSPRSATTATRRSRAGSSAARPTCATTRSTATWRTRAEQNALIFVSTETDEERIYSFRELHAEVQRMAAMPAGAGRQAGRPRADLHADDRPRRRSRCWPARASARSTRWCSAASPAAAWPAASTTPSRR